MIRFKSGLCVAALLFSQSLWGQGEGVTYTDIDDYLEGKVISPEAQAKIEGWWHKTQHKRHLPITVFDEFWK